MIEWEIMLLLNVAFFLIGHTAGFVLGIKVDATEEVKREEIEGLRRRRRRKRRTKYGYID